MQIYLISSTIRKTVIDLNLYKYVKNPLLLILLFITFMFSVVVKLLLYSSVTKCLIQYLQERLKQIITNIIIIGKFNFHISMSICKAKFYFPIGVLRYISVGCKRFDLYFVRLTWKLLVILRISFFLWNDILWNSLF